MASRGTYVTAPAISISRTYNISTSTTTTISSALSVTQDVVGLVPVVGPQLQSLCSLAIKVVNGLESLKDLQDDERKLLEKVQDALRIINETKDDERSIPIPGLKDELLRVESSLLSIEIYLETRKTRSLRQRLTTLISQRDTRNATQCREYLESALQKFQLVCIIKMRLELTEMKLDVVGHIKKLGETIKGFLHPPPPAYTVHDDVDLPEGTCRQDNQRGAKLGGTSPSTGQPSRRSVTPMHAGHVRSRDEFEEDNPSKRARTLRRSESREPGSRQRSGDRDVAIFGEEEFLAGSGGGGASRLCSPVPAQGDDKDSERGVSPLPRKRRRSNADYHRSQRHGHGGRLGVIDENAVRTTSMPGVETQSSSKSLPSPLASAQNMCVESERLADSGDASYLAAASQPRTLKRKREMFFRT